MKLIRNRRDGTIAIAATTVLCSLAAVRQLPADPQQGSPRSVQTDSNSTIPFDPPVVHPGWPLDDQTFKREPLRGKMRQSVTRDLMFHDEDRKVFKALHPFHLRRPRTFSVQKRPRSAVPSAPDSKQRRMKI